jgi:hypothetical protein
VTSASGSESPFLNLTCPYLFRIVFGMKLSHVTDKILLIDTKTLVTSERGLTTKVLHHLKEIDRRKLYSDLKYSSLFDYCLRELGYSEASAQRRIVAARILAEIPEIEKKLDEGLLTLTNISQVNQFFKDSNSNEKRKILKEIEGLTKKECEKKLFKLSGKKLPARETKKRISEDKIQVAVVLSDETIKVLDKLKALLGKDLSMDELLQFMAKETIKSVEKEKFKQVERPRKSLPPAEVGRTIPAAVKREVYKRDQKCTNCGSIHRLNYDHRHPYALGGPTSAENLRLLCFQCNQRASIKAGFTHILLRDVGNRKFKLHPQNGFSRDKRRRP